MRGGITQQRGGIGQRTRRAIGSGQPLETFELFRDAFRLVGMGEVRHQRDFAHCRMRFQFFHHCRNLLRRKAQTVHAGVDLEPYRQGVAARVGIEHGQLLRAVDDAGQFVFGQQRQLIGSEEPFQQQDGLAETRFAQGDGIAHIEQRETLRFVQCLGHAQQTVAVGIRLDDRHDAAGGEAARHTQIVLQRGKIDVGLYRAGHEFKDRAG